MIKVSAGIIRKNGSILLCRRKPTARYPLEWEFPGGKFEAGESALECLRRELREELSIEIADAKPYHIQKAFYPDSGMFEVHFFTVDEFAGEPVNNVFDAIRWIRPGDLGSFTVLEGNKEIIRLLLNERT